MPQELIYTSAPRGLKPGTQGFCTVVCTQGMPGPLALQLEGLSGYRHLFPPESEQASLNPVVYSHLILQVGGRKYHVLSRICAAGLDYSRRSNKLAHHVVLTEKELPSQGPAWLLSQPGFMETQWDGQVKLLAEGRPLPKSPLTKESVYPATWEKVTGEAGWAGVLAETALWNQPACLICPVGMDPLPLLAEALELLPPPLQWKVTFSTYFTGLPAGMSVLWRCVLQGTPEEIPTRRSRGFLLVDLTTSGVSVVNSKGKPVTLPHESAGVQAARKGQRLPLPEPSRPPVPSVMPTPLDENSSLVPPSLEEKPSIVAFPSTLPTPTPSHVASEPSFPTTKIHGFSRKRSFPWFAFLTGAVLLLLLGMTLGISLWIWNQGANECAQIDQGSSPREPSGKSSTGNTDISPKPNSGTASSPSSQGSDPASQAGTPTPEKPKSSPNNGKPSSDNSSEGKSASESTSKNGKPKDPAPPSTQPASSGTEGSKGENPSPPMTATPSQLKNSNSTSAKSPPKHVWMPLPKPVSGFQSGNPNETSLEEPSLLGEDFQLELLPTSLENGGINLEWKFQDRIGKFGTRNINEWEEIGRFTLQKGKLDFRWGSVADVKKYQECSQYLPDALLLVKRDEEVIGYIHLRSYPKVASIKLKEVPLEKPIQIETIETTVDISRIKIYAQLWGKGNERQPLGEGAAHSHCFEIPHKETHCQLRISVATQPNKSSEGKTSLQMHVSFENGIENGKTFPGDRMEEIISSIEKHYQEIEKRIDSEKKSDSQKQKEVQRLQAQVQQYQQVIKWLKPLCEHEIHYVLYHEVKDSRGKPHRVCVGVSNEKMLVEPTDPGSVEGK